MVHLNLSQCLIDHRPLLIAKLTVSSYSWPSFKPSHMITEELAHQQGLELKLCRAKVHKTDTRWLYVLNKNISNLFQREYLYENVF